MAADHSLTRKAEITPAEMSGGTPLDRLHCEFRSALIKHFMDRNIVMRAFILSAKTGCNRWSLPVWGYAPPERSAIVGALRCARWRAGSVARGVSLLPSRARAIHAKRQILTMARQFDWAG